MYSNDYTQIKSGLVNYLGACITSLPDTMSASAKSHFIVGELATQMLELSKKEDGSIDLFICKPLFRSVVYVLKQEIERMKDDIPYTKPVIETYENVILVLTSIVERTEESNDVRE